MRRNGEKGKAATGFLGLKTMGRLRVKAAHCMLGVCDMMRKRRLGAARDMP